MTEQASPAYWNATHSLKEKSRNKLKDQERALPRNTPETRKRECRKLIEKADLNTGSILFANSNELLSEKPCLFWCYFKSQSLTRNTTRLRRDEGNFLCQVRKLSEKCYLFFFKYDPLLFPYPGIWHSESQQFPLNTFRKHQEWYETLMFLTNSFSLWGNYYSMKTRL